MKLEQDQKLTAGARYPLLHHLGIAEVRGSRFACPGCACPLTSRSLAFLQWQQLRTGSDPHRVLCAKFQPRVCSVRSATIAFGEGCGLGSRCCPSPRPCPCQLRVQTFRRLLLFNISWSASGGRIMNLTLWGPQIQTCLPGPFCVQEAPHL